MWVCGSGRFQHFLLIELLARCKLVPKMNLQLVNIMLTNLVVLYPFLRMYLSMYTKRFPVTGYNVDKCSLLRLWDTLLSNVPYCGILHMLANVPCCGIQWWQMFPVVRYNAGKCSLLWDIMLANVPYCGILYWQMFPIVGYNTGICSLLWDTSYAGKCSLLRDSMLADVPCCGI